MCGFLVSADHGDNSRIRLRGPDLTRIGAERAADWLRGWITNPEAVDPSANMPAFGDTLTTSELDAVVAFLSERR